MDNNSKLVIVSNRLPVTLYKDGDGKQQLKKSSGGLVSGLREIHEQNNSLWVGYLGALDGSVAAIDQFLDDNALVDVTMTNKIYDKYYNGYANGTLWPLFHNFLATMSISDGHWHAYVKANQLFAERIQMFINPNDRIWVHDYQLMLLPRMLRNHYPDLKIAYFHHIPFPSSEIFRAIPRRKELIDGLLGADYIGFHTYDYVRHFLQSTQRLAGIKTKVNEIIFEDRPIKVAAHPLGVDFKAFSTSRSSVFENNPEYLKDKDRVTILGIDRLDYTKGLPERLKSFARFLEFYPEFVGKVRLIQICVPSRQDIGSYNRIRSQVERLVGKINGEFSRTDYIPVEYIFRSIPQNEVVDLYKQADVMLVTPLRDGLNLVCKEYIAARTDLDGCLILSEFAGSASEMGEALQVNPYDIDTVARTLKKALSMPYSERTRRVKILRRRMQENDNISWAKSFIKMWEHHDQDNMKSSLPLIENQQEDLIKSLCSKKRIFLFLDYDGTLAPIRQRPELALPDKNLDAVMESLDACPQIKVSIVTGRPKDFCEKYLTRYQVSFVAEHGSFLKGIGEKEWEQVIAIPGEEIKAIRSEILELLELYQKSVPNSHIEVKDTCIVWHYRESEPIFASQQAQILAESLEQMLAKTTWSVYHGKKSLEIRQSLAHKGFGVETILERESWDHTNDALVTVGDDTTDEDMHRVHPDDNDSIHIGSASAYSKFYLDSPEKLYEFLTKLAASCRQQIKHSG